MAEKLKILSDTDRGR